MRVQRRACPTARCAPGGAWPPLVGGQVDAAAVAELDALFEQEGPLAGAGGSGQADLAAGVEDALPRDGAAAGQGVQGVADLASAAG